VIAGPSGVGKGTVVGRVRELVPELHVSVSVTTRPPRATEREGIDYHFVSDGRFDELVAGHELLEWAEIFGHRSGTPAGPIERVLAQGGDALLEIDVQGAQQVRRARPDAVLIFLEPPSLAELERRLRTRATETEEKLRRRLEKAGWEQQQRGWFDHVVVNDELEAASSQVAAIIQASRRPSDGHGSEPDGSDGDMSERIDGPST
jgi:guanylate kinase